MSPFNMHPLLIHCLVSHPYALQVPQRPMHVNPTLGGVGVGVGRGAGSISHFLEIIANAPTDRFFRFKSEAIESD